jgi:hypothetical protein
MAIPEAVIEVVTIWLPEFLGERISGIPLRRSDGRWERVASGDRRRAEDAVRFLRRQHLTAWVHPAGRNGHEVVVRTPDAEVARRLLNAPSSGRE